MSNKAHTVFFSARIPKALYDRFLHFFPHHGANTCVLEIMLEKLLDECEKHPDVYKLVEDSIKSMIIDKRRNHE